MEFVLQAEIWQLKIKYKSDAVLLFKIKENFLLYIELVFFSTILVKDTEIFNDYKDSK